MARLALVIVLSTFSAVTGAETSCAHWLRSELTPSQTQALLRANSGDYKVSVLTGWIEGKRRHVILLGEAHMKDLAAKKDGQAVVKEFDFRGLEGTNPQIFWGGKALTWTIHAAYTLSKLGSLGRRTESSTLDDAVRTERLHRAAERIQERLQTGELNLTQLSDLYVTIGDETLSGNEVYAEMGLTPGQLLDKAMPVNLALERGHQPGIIENLQSVLLPSQMFSGVAAFLGDTLNQVDPGNALSAHLSPVVWGVAIFSAAQLSATKILRPRFQEHTWYKVAFAIQDGLLNGRNRIMVNNIQKAFRDYPEQSAMLVIVGRDHVEGMRKLLAREAGFLELPLAPN